MSNHTDDERLYNEFARQAVNRPTRDELECTATEAEMRYVRTGLTIDAEKAVAARKAVDAS